MSIRGEWLHAWLYGLFNGSDRRLAEDVYDQALVLFMEAGVDTVEGRDQLIDHLADHVFENVPHLSQTFERQQLISIVQALFDYENLFELPDVDWSQHRTTSEWWGLRDVFLVQRELAADFDTTCGQIANTLANLFGPVADHTPHLPPRHQPDGDLSLSAPKLDVLGALPSIMDQVAGAVFDDEIVECDLFSRTRLRLERNLVIASGGNPDSGEPFRRAPIPPSKAAIADRAELLSTYLGGTPLTQLFAGDVRIIIPQNVRFEHHHIVAGSGHGKTQTLQYLIAHDLQQVIEHKASVVVIDSQGDLIRTIQQLEMVNADNLVLIDPTDVAYPVCLNLFDVQMERINAYSPLHREQMLNGILELYDFVLGSLLGAEMTQKQSVIFRYVTRLLLHIPDATIHTMLALFQEGGFERYRAYINQLEGTARLFFEDEFDSREFTQTKRQVVRRLYGILENQTFNRMFSHPRSKLDLFSEMNAGKIILINTAKDLLKETGTEIFGRFFIAMITQAAQERATLPPDQRLPTFVYVDEAQDYFDDNIQIILSQMRKQNVGLVAAHQYLDQLSPKLQSAFTSNTSIKFAGGVSAKDARAFANEMQVPPDFILGQKRGSFASAIRGVTSQAISLSFPFGHMEALPKQSKAQSEALRGAMRERFAVPIEEMGRAGYTPQSNKAGPDSTDKADQDIPDDPDNPDVTPSSEL